MSSGPYDAAKKIASEDRNTGESVTCTNVDQLSSRAIDYPRGKGARFEIQPDTGCSGFGL